MSILETNALCCLRPGDFTFHRVVRQEKTHCDVKVLCVTGSLLAIYTRPSYKTHRGWERQLSIETDYAEKPLEWHFSCVKRDERTAFDPAKLCKWQCLLGQ